MDPEEHGDCSDKTIDQTLPGSPGPGLGYYYHYSAGLGRDKHHPMSPDPTMKDFEKQITELKKENFNLKLRIYFLEEQIQKNCEGSSEELHRTNIELKVEVESLKHDLQEKQKLLLKASKAVESLTGDVGKIQLKKVEVEQGHDLLFQKIQDLEKELETKNAEVDKIGALLDQERTQRFDTENRLSAVEEQYSKTAAILAEKDWTIEHLNETLDSKDALITQLKTQLSIKPSPANSEGNPPEKQECLDTSKNNECEDEPDYSQLIFSLEGEKKMFTQFIKSMGECRNLQKDLDAIAVLRRQLIENIKANQELSKILVEKIKSQSRDNDTFSFLGDQTTYLSLDHLNQNVDLMFELQDKTSKGAMKDYSDGTGGYSNQCPVNSNQTVHQGFHKILESRNTLDQSHKAESDRETRLDCQNPAPNIRESNIDNKHFTTHGENYSSSEHLVVHQTETFFKVNGPSSDKDVEKQTKSIGIQVEIEDLQERSVVLPALNMQMESCPQKTVCNDKMSTPDNQNRGDADPLVDSGTIESHTENNQLSPKEINGEQNDLNKLSKKSRLPVLLKSSVCMYSHEKTPKCLSDVQDNLKIQEELQNYKSQIRKLSEELHYAYLEIEQYKKDEHLIKECSSGENLRDYSADGSSHTPSRLVPGYRMWSDQNGRHVLGLLEDYDALQKQILEGRGMLHEIEVWFDDGVNTAVSNIADDFGSIMYEKIRRTTQSMEEAMRLMNLLWRVSLPLRVPEIHSVSEDEKLRMEIARLKMDLFEQNQFSSQMTNRFYSENQMEDSMRLILEQVSMTHKILRKARHNLERHPVNTHH
ncbi:CDK5 regulatory subunit-associated 2-like isoform X3 [Pelobates cultripes]|uniref:CDK5 regulatory subunit-associated 2-like isoform X3 n=1 Tax=Pelobates cultripes TaxID=61616 RepID=A0AAD1QX31_PELCU|nr:CDK5 regulatory subunit-associated 2-like isoform X3 [Pelobates cultripes]